MAEQKFKCKECGAIVAHDRVPEAVNPFNRHEMIFGCPECREVNSLIRACDVDGCNEVSSCVLRQDEITDTDYRFVCSFHCQKKNHNKKRDGTKTITKYNKSMI